MKSSLLVLLFYASYSFAELPIPTAKMTFRVKDDFGKVVSGAMVKMSTFREWIPGEGFGKDVHEEIEGVTDTNGVVSLTIPAKRAEIEYRVITEGRGSGYGFGVKIKVDGKIYYHDIGGDFRFKALEKNNWQPWNPVVDIQLKEVVNPIPMYARFLKPRNFKIPVYNKPLGYDLLKSDWLPPHGNGEVADFIFRLDTKLGEVTPDKIQYHDSSLMLTFSNEGDGIQELLIKPREGSRFKLPRFAPESGYESKWLHKSFNHKNESYYEHNENQNYIFRIRTKKDDEGKILSALYGKINGPISYGVYGDGGKLRMMYYLNSVPNDRNLEFDPSRNLFKNLKSSEQVREP